MGVKRWLTVLALLALLGLALLACAGGEDSPELQVTSTPAEEVPTGEDALQSKAKGVFSDIVTRLASAPLIGGPVQKLLARLAPEDHWCAGAILLALVGLLVAAVASTARD